MNPTNHPMTDNELTTLTRIATALERIATALEPQPEMNSIAEYKPTLYDHVSLISDNLVLDPPGTLSLIYSCLADLSDAVRGEAGKAARTK
jgi:hypothetical protein